MNSDNPGVAIVPAAVQFPAGASSVTIVVNSIAPGTTLIHAKLPPHVAEATVQVTVTGPGAITVPTITTQMGQQAPFAITLGTPAPSGGVTVHLSSSDSSHVTVFPASVTIPAGETQAAPQPQVSGAGIGSATITASATGYTTAHAVVTATGSDHELYGADHDQRGCNWKSGIESERRAGSVGRIDGESQLG